MSTTKRLPTGSPIPGSRFLRAYCDRCNEPMRVTSHVINLRMPIFCEKCEPSIPPNRAATKDDDPGPWGENAIRALEDGVQS